MLQYQFTIGNKILTIALISDLDFCFHNVYHFPIGGYTWLYIYIIIKSVQNHSGEQENYRREDWT